MLEESIENTESDEIYEFPNTRETDNQSLNSNTVSGKSYSMETFFTKFASGLNRWNEGNTDTVPIPGEPFQTVSYLKFANF